MKKLIIFLFIFTFLWCDDIHCHNVLDPVDYVNPLVGTLSTHTFSNGNTYPAIAMPWGMNFWTPQTGEMGNGWTYNYANTVIRGFKQTHQPSPWINDYGQFSIMPVVGSDKIDQNSRTSWISHKTEIVKPYYYGVYLADHDIYAELAPTERAAVMNFTFPKSDESYVIVDAFDNGSYVQISSDKRRITGYTTKNSGGVPDNFKNYFVVEFDRPFEGFDVIDDNRIVAGASEISSNHAMARVKFNTQRGDKIVLKVASSFISPEQAVVNLREVGDSGLDEIEAAGRDRWNDVLGKIEIEGGTEEQYRTFYSCLYRSTLFPRKFYEITDSGKTMHYSPYNGKIEDGYMYTDTGFWDTFRCLFPFLNVMYPSVNKEIQEALANTYKESSFLPEWASPGHRDCMVGNNSASVVADAIIKGITNDEDIEALYEAMLNGTRNRHPKVKSTGRWGHEQYNTLGYVPYDVNIPENAARTLEYAYNDWCILQVAKQLNRPADEVAELEKRSKNYANLFDKEHNLMVGRNEDGSFQRPFSAYKWGGAFTEGNSWHYTWSVFHDPQGLVDLMGGSAGFNKMLDSVFVVPPIYDDSYYGSRIHEITEMQVANMGNYAHGNQPAQHMIYLYNYSGEPWKAQYWTREVMDKLYSAQPDGYCGDEDNGQTSAWYVFSSLGFYPVCPGSDQYIIGSPLFFRATLELENGKKVVITAENNTPTNRYINSAKLNGKPHSKNYITYSDLMNGANIEFSMDDKPNKKRGIGDNDKPYSMSLESF